MTESSRQPNSWVTTLAWMAGIVGSLAVVAVLAAYLVQSGAQQPVGTARADERKKLWTELQAQNQEVLNTYAVLKADNGVYRLPVQRALEVLASDCKDGNAVGRAKLLKRLENSTKAVTYE